MHQVLQRFLSLIIVENEGVYDYLVLSFIFITNKKIFVVNTENKLNELGHQKSFLAPFTYFTYSHMKLIRENNIFSTL